MHLCSWLLALLVLEVTLVLSFPRKAHVICVKERVKNLSLLIVLLLVCVNAHFFWTYGLVRFHPSAEKQYCIFTEYGGFYSKYFRGLVWPIMDTLFAAMLPNTIIVACLTYIFLRGCLKAEKLRVLMENHFVIDAESLRSFIVMTIVLGAFSVVMTLPETAYNLFEFAMERLQLEHIGNRETYFAQRTLAQLLCYIFRDLFLAFKVFVYVIMWKSFRERAVGVLTLRKYRTYCKKRKNFRDEYVREESARRAKLQAKRSHTTHGDATEEQPWTPSTDPEASHYALLGASSVV
ncbi:hypothetical protein CAPTEDRAFT_187072 [Capitella teleta]|uniref:G-protein coupled receptors family 1 profile domain-containing protein n=1 Tax=Capitella teleta TaxID=283909 RepID=R7V4N4_CAPTE|nr:hypothetical protein CAPTEDRAFT_187072 [Capitella teleta]|eukprot:ELU11321.1 hypothetical protein CAPTEDRAFT_187072 [Capitella teleta]